MTSSYLVGSLSITIKYRPRVDSCSQSSQCVICSWHYVDMMICMISMYSVRRRPFSDDTCNNYYYYNQNLFIIHKIMADLLRYKLFFHPNTYDFYGRVLNVSFLCCHGKVNINQYSIILHTTCNKVSKVHAVRSHRDYSLQKRQDKKSTEKYFQCKMRKCIYSMKSSSIPLQLSVIVVVSYS